MNRGVATFGLLMAIGAGVSLAQPPAQPVDDSTRTETAETAPETGDKVAQEGLDAPDETTAATAEPEPAGSDDSPFDYQASEQISEDLSVSFPIDI
ncbi:MAG: hypothetical protein EP301_03055 [Gammaproteobacteria bacterium]|nr:MAG: hypothetical protein EP301_03055 [Gammaproteobacteria bacterium]